MQCEGSCGRSFRDGDRVYAIPTRIVVVRNGKEQFAVVDKLLCEADARLAGRTFPGDPVRVDHG